MQSGLYQSRMSRYQAQVAEQNKERARTDIGDAIDQGQDEQRRLGREVAGRVGAQTARMAANNIDITMGSAARTIADTRMVGYEDQAALAENTRRQVRAMQTDVWNFESEKRAAKSEAKQAMTASAFGMATTALGGATQYSKYRAGRRG